MSLKLLEKLAISCASNSFDIEDYQVVSAVIQRSTSFCYKCDMAQWRRLEDALQCGCAYLLNTRDRHGNAVIVLQKKNTKWNMEANSIILAFFAKRLSDKSKDKCRNLTVIVDGRDTSFREIQSVLRELKDALGSQLDKILLLRVESWGQQRLDHCAKSNIYPQPITVGPSRLQNYIQPDVLPKQLGGNMDFNHQKWMESVMGREKLWQEGQAVSLDTDKLLLRLREDLGSQPRFSIAGLEGIMEHHRTHYSASALAITEVLQSGSTLLEREDQDTTEEFGFRKDDSEFPQSKQEIQNLLDELKEKLKAMEEAWKEAEDLLRHLRQVGFLYQRVNKAVSWLLGPAEALLPSNMGIGLDLTAAKDLRKKHELIEVELREKYAEISCLCHDIKLMGNNGEIPQDLNLQKEYMQVLSRRLAAWAEKRRALLIKSSSFYRKVQEALSRVSSTTDYLRSLESRLTNISVVESGLTFIEARHTSIFDIMEHVREESQKLLELLHQPLLSIKGQEFVPDNMSEYNHVMELSQLTVKTCSHATSLMDNKKLHMQRLWQLWTCEKDAKEAIRWIKEMEELLVECYGAIGTSVEEITQLKFQHRKFEETASQAYEYCNKLLKTSRSLRDVCGRTDQTSIKLQNQLTAIWSSFVQTSQENMTRKCVANVFHRNMDQHLKSLDELYQKMSEDLGTSSEAETRNVQRMYLKEREKLLQEVARTMRLGKLLRSRVKEPILPQIKSTDSSNGAIEAINQKILKAKAKAEELDGLFCSPAVTPESSPTLLRRTKIRRSPTPCQHSPRPERKSPTLRPFSPIIRRKSPSSVSSSPEPLRKKQVSSDPKGLPSKSDDTITSIKQLNLKVSKALEYMKRPAKFSSNLKKIKQQSRVDQVMEGNTSHVISNGKNNHGNSFQRLMKNESQIPFGSSKDETKSSGNLSKTSSKSKNIIKSKMDSTLKVNHSDSAKGNEQSSDFSESEDRNKVNKTKRNGVKSPTVLSASGTMTENLLAKYQKEGNDPIVVSDENSEILSLDPIHAQDQKNRLSAKLKRGYTESSRHSEGFRRSEKYSKDHRSFTKSSSTMYDHRDSNNYSKGVRSAGKRIQTVPLTKGADKHDQALVNITSDTYQSRGLEKWRDSYLSNSLTENISDKGIEKARDFRRTPSYNSLPARVSRSTSPQPYRFFSQETIGKQNDHFPVSVSPESAVNFLCEETDEVVGRNIPTPQENIESLEESQKNNGRLHRLPGHTDDKQTSSSQQNIQNGQHSSFNHASDKQALTAHEHSTNNRETFIPRRNRNENSSFSRRDDSKLLTSQQNTDGKTSTSQQSMERQQLDFPFSLPADSQKAVDYIAGKNTSKNRKYTERHGPYQSDYTNRRQNECEQPKEKITVIPKITVEQYSDSASVLASVADAIGTTNEGQTPCFSSMPINAIPSTSSELNTKTSYTQKENEGRDGELPKASSGTHKGTLQLRPSEQKIESESIKLDMETDSKRDDLQRQPFEHKIECEEKDLNVEIAFYSSVPITIQCTPSPSPFGLSHINSIGNEKTIEPASPSFTNTDNEGDEAYRFQNIRGAPQYSSMPERINRISSSQVCMPNTQDTKAGGGDYFPAFNENENEGPSSLPPILYSDIMVEADNYSSTEQLKTNNTSKENIIIPRNIRISSPQPYIPYSERMLRGRINEYSSDELNGSFEDDSTHLINIRGSLAYSSMPTKRTKGQFSRPFTHPLLKEKKLEFSAEVAASSAATGDFEDLKNGQETRFCSSRPLRLDEVPQAKPFTADVKLSYSKDNRERPRFSSMPIHVNRTPSPRPFPETIQQRTKRSSKEPSVTTDMNVKPSGVMGARGKQHYSSMPLRIYRSPSPKLLEQSSDKTLREKESTFEEASTSEDASQSQSTLKNIREKTHSSKPLRVYRSPSPQATVLQRREDNSPEIPSIITYTEREKINSLKNQRGAYSYSSMPIRIKPTSSKLGSLFSRNNVQDKHGTGMVSTIPGTGTQPRIPKYDHSSNKVNPNLFPPQHYTSSTDQNLQVSSEVPISQGFSQDANSRGLREVRGRSIHSSMPLRISRSPSPQSYLSSSEQVRQHCDIVASRLSSMAEIIGGDKSSGLKGTRGNPLYSSMPVRIGQTSSPKPYSLPESKSSIDLTTTEQPLRGLNDIRGKPFYSSLPMKISRSPSPQAYLSSSDEVLHQNFTPAVKRETSNDSKHVHGKALYSSKPARVNSTPSPKPYILPSDKDRGISPEPSTFLDVNTKLKSNDIKRFHGEPLYTLKPIRVSRTPSPQPFIPLKDKEGNPIFPKKQSNISTDTDTSTQASQNDKCSPSLNYVQDKSTNYIKQKKQFNHEGKVVHDSASKKEQRPKPPPRSDSLKRKFSCLLKKYRTTPESKSKKEAQISCPPPRPSSLPTKVVTFNVDGLRSSSSDNPLKRPSESPPLPPESPSSGILTRKLLGLPPKPPKQDKTSKTLSKPLLTCASRKTFQPQKEDTFSLNHRMSKSDASLSEHDQKQTQQKNPEKYKKTQCAQNNEACTERRKDKSVEKELDEKQSSLATQLEQDGTNQPDVVQENNPTVDEGTPLSSLEYLDDDDLPPLESPSLVNIPLFTLPSRMRTMPSFSDPSLATRTPSPVPLADSPSTSDPGWFPSAISSSRPSTPSPFLSIIHFPETTRGEILEEALTEKGHEEIEERLMTKELETDARKLRNIDKDQLNKNETQLENRQAVKLHGKRLDISNEASRHEQYKVPDYQLQRAPTYNEEEGLRLQQKVLKQRKAFLYSTLLETWL